MPHLPEVVLICSSVLNLACTILGRTGLFTSIATMYLRVKEYATVPQPPTPSKSAPNLGAGR